MARRTSGHGSFERSGGAASVLLLHGFSGAPAEMRELGDRLHARGYGVIAPALPGHAGDANALKGLGVDDYLRAAEEAYDVASLRSERLYIIGLSMGGALALHLAQSRSVSAIVTINAPVFMPAHVQHGVPFVARHAADAPLLVNLNALFGSIGYATVPASAVTTFLDVIAHVRGSLHEVRSPLLVLHSSRDATVPHGNAHEIMRAVASEDKQAVIFEEGRHLITVGRWLDTIEPPIIEFLTRMDRGARRDSRTNAGLS